MVMAVERDAEGKTRRGISLDPEEERYAKALAAKHHGDNVSRLIRHLIRDAWVREHGSDHDEPAEAA